MIQRMAVIFGVIAAAGSARGMSWEVPPGTWSLREPGETFTLRSDKGHTLTLDWRWKRGDRRRLTISGRYKVTVIKHNHTGATLEVSAIGAEVRIGGKPARRDLTEVDALGTTIRTGQKLRLTLVGGCSGKRDWLQLCLHEERKGKKPHVFCRTLHAPRAAACDPGPPIDGSKINPPPEELRGKRKR
jgi:hypothetical protein